MSAPLYHVSAAGVRFAFDATTGLLDGFVVEDEGRKIAPLHRAPWVGGGEAMPEGEPPLIAKLGGDFFCAPFALSDDGSPLHGWPPNSAWDVTTDSGGVLQATLQRRVRGAALSKKLSVRDGHPFVYQWHIFAGGEGRITAANHANVSVKSGALIRTSPKLVWETPASPQETDPARGRSALRYPAQSTDPSRFLGVDGEVDLTRYPWASRHEDFVVGVEASGHGLGWTAVTRLAEGDVYLSLRDPRTAPMTMLWHSNGGRDYAPWSGRHFGCLGVEEGAAEHMLGHSTEADLTGPGALTLRPDGTAEIRHAIGAIAWPCGAAVTEVLLGSGEITVVGEDGFERTVPFDDEFLF